MKNIIIKNLTREQFNKLVERAEKELPKLGIKKIDSVIEYSYIDKNNVIIKLICNEPQQQSSGPSK